MHLDHAGTIGFGTWEVGASELDGAHETSIRRDIEAGRSPEIEALESSSAELERLTDTPTLHIDITSAMANLLAGTMKTTD